MFNDLITIEELVNKVMEQYEKATEYEQFIENKELQLKFKEWQNEDKNSI